MFHIKITAYLGRIIWVIGLVVCLLENRELLGYSVRFVNKSGFVNLLGEKKKSLFTCWTSLEWMHAWVYSFSCLHLFANIVYSNMYHFSHTFRRVYLWWPLSPLLSLVRLDGFCPTRLNPTEKSNEERERCLLLEIGRVFL